MEKMFNAHVPARSGKGSSFLDYEQCASLRNRAAEIHAAKRASLLVLHMDPMARQICLRSGGDSFMEGVDVATLIATLRHNYLPGATDQVYQEVAKFLNYKRAAQLMERFLLEFDMPRTKSEKKILQGLQFPGSFLSILRMQNAVIPRNEKSLVMASVRGSLDYPLVAKQMRQVSQPRGGAHRGDVLLFTTGD